MTQEPQKQIEVEIKYEVVEEKFIECMAELLQRGFKISFEGVISDVYTEIAKSPLGGHDFTRYRIDESNGNVVETIKTWEQTSIRGQDKRVELERELTPTEYSSMNKVALVSLRKHRTSLTSEDSHVDMDQFFVPTGFSPACRFFIEVEKIVFADEDIQNTRNSLSEFAHKVLGLSEECRLSMLKLATSYQK